MAAGTKNCSSKNSGSSSTVQATAVAIAGRTSRACDVCGMQRARWFCAADEAYLCQRCDASVHGANALARRHERNKLGPTSMYKSHKRKLTVQASQAPAQALVQKLQPSRKRSKRSRRPNPRHKLHKKGSEEAGILSKGVNERRPEEAGAHDVPAFITVNQQAGLPHELHDFQHVASTNKLGEDFKGNAAHVELKDELHQFAVPDGYLDSEIDFDETKGSLIGEAGSFSGAEDGFGEMELTGLSFSEMVTFERRDGSERTILEATTEGSAGAAAAGSPFLGVFPVKVKNEKLADISAENRSERIKEEVLEMLRCSLKGHSKEELGIPSLRLNYEDVLSAWSDQSFWTEDTNHLQTVPGHDNQFNHSGIMEMWLVPDMSSGNTQGLLRSDVSHGDEHGGGREARVLRYKEKRRTRLFCKTVRYEVRKLNAERRPRMKGRFVRRTSVCT